MPSTKLFHIFMAIVSLLPFGLCQNLQKQIFEDALAVWQSFRDPDNGAWCDTLRFNKVPMVQCGQNNNFYSSAGTGTYLLIFFLKVYLKLELLVSHTAESKTNRSLGSVWSKMSTF